MKLEELENASLIIINMANELSEALEDKKINIVEAFEIGRPLLRVPRTIRKWDQVKEELKIFIQDPQARIELITYMANKFELTDEMANLLVQRTLYFYLELHEYIQDVGQIIKGITPAAYERLEIPNHETFAKHLAQRAVLQ